MRRRALILGVFALVVIGCSVWFVNKYFAIEARDIAARLFPPPTPLQLESRQLKKIAGHSASNCGHVRYRADAEAAIRCVEDSMKGKRAFYVSFEWHGFDATGISGLAADAHGGIYEVQLEEHPVATLPGTGLQPRARPLVIRRCDKTPSLVEAWRGRFLSCTAQ